MNISIEGLSKAKVLAALYNVAKPQGMGFLRYDPKPMTEEEAAEILKQTTYFDYLKGRVMKIDLKSDTEFESGWFDRDNGPEAALEAIEAVRNGSVTSPLLQVIHEFNKQFSAEEARLFMETPTTMSEGVVVLGGQGVADKLGPAIDKALRKEG